jgi:hypothetical protein
MADMTYAQREVLARWIGDLRSGKYSQTTGALCNGTGYCCLGVLAETQLGKKKNPLTIGNIPYLFWDGGESANIIPYRIWGETTGLAAVVQERLIAANDDNQYTFDQIADLIAGYMR